MGIKFMAAWVALAAGTAGAADVQKPAGDSVLSYSGVARSLQSNQFLYGEHHFLRYQNGDLAERVVLYTCADGSAFARKVVGYAHPLAPDFELVDESSGLREGLRPQGAQRQVFYQESRAAPERDKAAPNALGLVADAGFDEFVRRRWEPLVAGQKQNIEFLVPSRLDSMSFQVKHLRSQTVVSQPAEVFELALAGVLGWVAPSIVVYYGVHDHVLLLYEGLSDLRDAGGNNYKARIEFLPNLRVPSDAASLDAAKHARVARCH
jgi:hypothetical protein